jgi:elongation factor 1-beta
VTIAPSSTQYPYAARWYKHIASYESDFAILPGDASSPYTAYGPDVSDAVNSAAPVQDTTTVADDNDDEIDLFGSEDEEDAEVARVREERLAAYKEKKAAKPTVGAKSVVFMEVKPWGMISTTGSPESYGTDRVLDDETDMAKLETAVRSVKQDGLVWGASKLVAVGYGIKKLQISLVVEDQKVSTVDLQEQIEAFDDYVQSSDVVSLPYRKILASGGFFRMLIHTLGCNAETLNSCF